MSKIPKSEELFDLAHTQAAELLLQCEYPWEALSRLGEFIIRLSAKLDPSYREISPGVFAAEDAIIADSARIEGPTIISHRAEIRHCAYIRGRVIVGEGAVIGNSSEIKNAIIFDAAQLPHYNYVGDSIIGYRAHFGAGAIASNLRLDRREVKVGSLPTQMIKLGSIVGDSAEIGCGTVLCPGTLIGRGAAVYPLSRVKGIIEAGEIFKGEGDN